MVERRIPNNQVELFLPEGEVVKGSPAKAPDPLCPTMSSFKNHTKKAGTACVGASWKYGKGEIGKEPRMEESFVLSGTSCPMLCELKVVCCSFAVATRDAYE